MPARLAIRIWSLAKAPQPRRRRGTVSARPLLVEQLDGRRLLATVTLTPVADTTIYQESGTLSNGVGGFFFSGQAAANAGVRRALLKFDVAGALPPGSHINQASLLLHVSKTRPGSAATDFGVSRLTDDWGEGTSDASGNEGTGALATTNDATWTSRTFNTASWTTPGGDFNATTSATTKVGGVGSYQWSSAQLTADAQLWADSPATQFDWILKEIDETVEGSARRFDSRESTSAASRPTLTLDFTPVNQPPTLDAIADPPAILEDASQQLVQLSGITAGTGDSQQISIIAASSNPALIPDPLVSYASPNATGSLSYTPVANQNGTAVITVTVKDNGGVANGGVDTLTRTFTVMINPVNDLPTLDPISDPTAVAQDSGLQTITLNGISAGPSETQVISVTATSSNPGLVLAPTVNYTSPNATGTLNYTPITGQNGSATITVTVRDAGLDGVPDNSDDATFTRTFEVRVFDPNAVNHPPSFIAGVDQAAHDDSGPVNVTGWATAISPGAPVEVTQTVTFIVISDNTSLFSVEPAVDSTGKLTFTPAPNAHGTAQITIRAKDDGGTANGGSDTSAPQTFTITITKLYPWHNTLHALDVTGSGGQADGAVVAGDALAVINYINAFGAGQILADATPGAPYVDTTGGPDGHGDNFVVAADALAVINYINAFGAGLPGPAGEGEATEASQSAANGISGGLFTLLALDIAEQGMNRRRLG